MRIQPRSWTFRKIDSAEAKRPGCRIFLIHADAARSEEHTSELQSQSNLVCRLLLEKKHVAIVHFDVHHGHGTADIIANDERVLMVSFFQHPLYPYSGAWPKCTNRIHLPLPPSTDGP